MTITITALFLLSCVLTAKLVRARKHIKMDADTIHQLFSDKWDLEASNEKAMRTIVMLYRERDSKDRECDQLELICAEAISASVNLEALTVE